MCSVFPFLDPRCGVRFVSVWDHHRHQKEGRPGPREEAERASFCKSEAEQKKKNERVTLVDGRSYAAEDSPVDRYGLTGSCCSVPSCVRLPHILAVARAVNHVRRRVRQRERQPQKCKKWPDHSRFRKRRKKVIKAVFFVLPNQEDKHHRFGRTLTKTAGGGGKRALIFLLRRFFFFSRERGGIFSTSQKILGDRFGGLRNISEFLSQLPIMSYEA